MTDHIYAMTFETRRSMNALQRIRDAIKSKALTAEQIARKIFLSKRSTSMYLMRMRRLGEIHIADYDCSGYPLAMYKLGAGVDAPKPPPKTYAERMARNPEAHRKLLEKARLKREAARYKPHPDPLVAALFGQRVR